MSNIKITGKSSDDEKVRPFLPREVNTLLEKSKDSDRYGALLHPYLGLVLNQGLSPHEAIGLQIGDITWDSGRQKSILTIKRGITKKKLGDTKNEYRKRSIALRDETKVYTDFLIKEAKRKKSIWLFSNEDDTRLNDIENIRGTKVYFSSKKGYHEHRNTRWYKLLEDCNISHRHIKNCRHTFTMTALDNKLYTLPELASMLGHKDMQIIIKHCAKHIKDKALDADTTIRMYGNCNTGGTLENGQNDVSMGIV